MLMSRSTSRRGTRDSGALQTGHASWSAECLAEALGPCSAGEGLFMACIHLVMILLA